MSKNEKKSETEISKFVSVSLNHNENFLKKHEEAKEVYNTCLQIVNDTIDIESKKLKSYFSNYQRGIPSFIATIQISAYEIVYNLLLGNVPGTYFAMRKLLEGSVDITIASLRFPDEKFSRCMERVNELRLRFDAKCDKLLPSWCNDNTKKKAKQLWHHTSTWAHVSGITRKFAEKIEEQKAFKPFPYPGSLALPHEYSEDDLSELKEMGGRLKALTRHIFSY